MAKSDGMTVLAVFRAAVKADRGPGSTVAVVRGSSGKARLYGITSLVRAEMLPADMEGRSLTPDKLASVLGVKLIVGGVACKAFLAEHKVALDVGNEVLGDVNAGGKGKGGFGRAKPFAF